MPSKTRDIQLAIKLLRRLGFKVIEPRMSSADAKKMAAMLNERDQLLAPTRSGR